MFGFARRQTLLRLLEAVEIRLLKLETQHKLIEQEWNGVYDKYRTAIARADRRAERAQTAQDAPGTTNGKVQHSELERWRVR